MNKPYANRKKAPPKIIQIKAGEQQSNDNNLTWRTIFFSILKYTATIVATATTGIVVYITTPLNEAVNRLIWKESAELSIVPKPSEVHLGGTFQLDAYLINKSPTPISEGVLTIQYPKHLIRPSPSTAPQLSAAIPEVKGSEHLNSSPLEFITDGTGEGKITFTYKTARGSEFSEEIDFSVLPPEVQHFPSRRNFGGRWNIDLGGIHGYMELREVARSIAGEYHLNDGNGGQIEGSRDGKTFRANFYRGSAPSRFAIEASFDPNPLGGDLELQGVAKLLIPTGENNTPWKEDGRIGFNAIATAE